MVSPLTMLVVVVPIPYVNAKNMPVRIEKTAFIFEAAYF